LKVLSKADTKLQELILFSNFRICSTQTNIVISITFENCSKDNVLVIELGARPGSSGDQELNIPVFRIEFNIVVIVVFGERERNDAGTGMGEREGLGVDGLGVTGQVARRADLALVGAALAAGEEVLAGKDLVDECVLVRR